VQFLYRYGYGLVPQSLLENQQIRINHLGEVMVTHFIRKKKLEKTIYGYCIGSFCLPSKHFKHNAGGILHTGVHVAAELPQEVRKEIPCPGKRGLRFPIEMHAEAEWHEDA
jgi:hypothetical protein